MGYQRFVPDEYFDPHEPLWIDTAERYNSETWLHAYPWFRLIPELMAVIDNIRGGLLINPPVSVSKRQLQVIRSSKARQQTSVHNDTYAYTDKLWSFVVVHQHAEGAYTSLLTYFHR